MNAATSSNTNHTMSKSRKTLASQIDRLDDILDGLADGLNDAVATIVRETVQIAVKEAVQAVLTEVLTNPEVLARLGVGVPAASSKPTVGDKIAGIKQNIAQRCRAAGNTCRFHAYKMRLWFGSLLQQGKHGAGKLWERSKCLTAQLWQHVRTMHHHKMPLLVALGAGLVAGALGCICGPWLNAILGAIAGFATVQAKLLPTQQTKEVGAML